MFFSILLNYCLLLQVQKLLKFLNKILNLNIIIRYTYMIILTSYFLKKNTNNKVIIYMHF